MKELVKGLLPALADLFIRIHFIDFPLENLVFLGQLEQICSWIKSGRKAYDCESLGKSK